MTNKKKKVPTLANLLHQEIKDENTVNSVELLASKVITQPVAHEEGRDKKNRNTIATTVTLPVPVKEKLEEIVFNERKSKKTQNDLLLEGIDLLFKSKGFPSIEELIRNSE